MEREPSRKYLEMLFLKVREGERGKEKRKKKRMREVARRVAKTVPGDGRPEG